MFKNILITSLKFLISAALIYWLLKSGKLDFSLLKNITVYPLSWLIAFILAILNLLLCAWRWRIILQARSKITLPYFEILQINWIGQFFSSVLPGSVTGDLIKIFYVQKINPELSKKFLLASSFIDRLMGLFGLIIIVGLSSLIFSQIVTENSKIYSLIYINFFLFFSVVAFLTVFFLAPTKVHSLLIKMSVLPLKTLWLKLAGLWEDLTSIRKKMFYALITSLMIQFFSVLIFWILIYPEVGEVFSFIQALCFIPLGFITLALPVAPSGLGVGHYLFNELFEMNQIAQGASLFNLFFVLTLVTNLLGIIPYLTKKMSHSN